VAETGEAELRPRPQVVQFPQQRAQSPLQFILQLDQGTQLSVQLGVVPLARAVRQLLKPVERADRQRRFGTGRAAIPQPGPQRSGLRQFSLQGRVVPALCKGTDAVRVRRPEARVGLCDQRFYKRSDRRFSAGNSTVQAQSLIEGRSNRERQRHAETAALIHVRTLFVAGTLVQRSVYRFLEFSHRDRASQCDPRIDGIRRSDLAHPQGANLAQGTSTIRPRQCSGQSGEGLQRATQGGLIAKPAARATESLASVVLRPGVPEGRPRPGVAERPRRPGQR